MDEDQISDNEVIEYLARKVLHKLLEELGQELPTDLSICSLGEAMMMIAKTAKVSPQSFRDIMQQIVINYLDF